MAEDTVNFRSVDSQHCNLLHQHNQSLNSQRAEKNDYKRVTAVAQARKSQRTAKEVIMTSDIEENGTETPARVSLRRFSFCSTSRMTLLQCVREFEAHLADHGKKDGAFQNVLDRFIGLTPPVRWRRMQKPKLKTVRDKFRSMLQIRKEEVKAYESASGVSEPVTEENKLLDEFLFEIKEKEETARMEAETASNRDRALTEAGRRLQEQGLQRRPASSGRLRQRSSESATDDWNEFTDSIEAQMAKKVKLQEDDLKMRKEELNMMKSAQEDLKNAQKDMIELMHAQNATASKLADAMNKMASKE